MTQDDSQTEAGEVLLAPFDLVADTSESARAKTAETFLELLGARVLNPKAKRVSGGMALIFGILFGASA
jgi:hypothetical protein